MLGNLFIDQRIGDSKQFVLDRMKYNFSRAEIWRAIRAPVFKFVELDDLKYLSIPDFNAEYCNFVRGLRYQRLPRDFILFFANYLTEETAYNECHRISIPVFLRIFHISIFAPYVEEKGKLGDTELDIGHPILGYLRESIQRMRIAAQNEVSAKDRLILHVQQRTMPEKTKPKCRLEDWLRPWLNKHRPTQK